MNIVVAVILSNGYIEQFIFATLEEAESFAKAAILDGYVVEINNESKIGEDMKDKKARSDS